MAGSIKAGIEISQAFYTSYKKDPKDIKQQAKYLFELAELYSKRAEEKWEWLPGVNVAQPNWTNYLRVFLLFLFFMCFCSFHSLLCI